MLAPFCWVDEQSMMSALDLFLAGRMGTDCQSLKKGRYTKERKKTSKVDDE